MQLLSITQIAKQLGKSRQMVWFLIRTGQLKAQMVGNQFVITAEDLLQFQNSKNKKEEK
jgi:excisionase family DNA binding protein